MNIRVIMNRKGETEQRRAGGNTLLDLIFRDLEQHYDEMVELRRDFHMYPELSFQEVRTPEKIADYHRRLGLNVRTNVGGRGVVAKLEGRRGGKTVALRADFDALPIHDAKSVPYKSKVDGVMHACGHDGHTASLLVLARILAKYRDRLEGNIVFIHQFAEELAPGGAKPMIEDGCLNGVDAIFGTHLWTPFPYGTIAYRSGKAMASADKFEIEVIGKGGHGGIPHEAIDATVTASQIVCALQQIVSRNIDPLKSAVISVGSFHSGHAFNVIAEKAKLVGTVRTFDPDVREETIEKMERLVYHQCQSVGAKGRFHYEKGYPAVVNDPQATQFVAQLARNIGKTFEMEPVMGGEDFAYYLQHVPGTFFFTGAGNSEIGADYPHHHERFDFDERAMVIGAKVLAACAVQYMRNGSFSLNSDEVFQ